MKKLKKFALLFMLAIGFQITTLADPPTPPDPGGNPGGGGVPVGSPIDDETLILLIMAGAYGAYKIYELRKNHNLLKTK